MRRNQRRNPRFRSIRRIGLVMAAVAGAAVFAIDMGARAERVSLASAPTLDDLLSRRESLARGHGGPPVSLEVLQERRRALQQLRSDIEGNLPPSLRTPKPRLPGLRRPKHALITEPSSEDSSSGNPDRLVRRPARRVAK